VTKQLISPQAFIERARPMLGAMYHTALLITDNAESAETALRQALLQVYAVNDAHDRKTLREQLKKAVRECAFARLQDMPLTDAERGDWHGAGTSAVVEDTVLSALLSRFQMEDRELQRYMLLRCGFALSHARAAEAADMDPVQAWDAYARFRARAAGARPEAFERSLARMCRMILDEGGAAPDMSAVCRAFERDAVLSERGNKKRRNLPGYILCAIGVVICMLLFWLMAVLLEPDSVPQAEEISGAARFIQKYL
jgi:hypothetical protein